MSELAAPLAPYGSALADYAASDQKATLLLRSSLGERDELPVSLFFREPEGFFPFEAAALDHCDGQVLDVGAGAGVHSLVLQARGFEVTALDVVPEAVEVMKTRGVDDARLGDVFSLDTGSFDTIHMLMNGIGPVGTLDGIERLLNTLHRRLRPGGQIIVDSGAPRLRGEPPDPDLVAWPAGRPAYAGEAWVSLEYRGARGGLFRELYVDDATFRERAARAGWSFDVLYWENASYVARLTRR